MAIEMTTLCKKLGVLPRAGGLLDQDSAQMFVVFQTLLALDEREANEAKSARR